MVVTQSVSVDVRCINPDCPRPYPQQGNNKFCQSCGALLRLNQRYLPLQQLGLGGFAVIYTVYDLETRTEKVLKVLIETAPKALELFAQEANVLVTLRHEGVPKVEPESYFQVKLRDRALPCLVMEKINGPTLEELLLQHPQGLPQTDVLKWLTQAIDILQALHEQQIIHRDIKPSNLMLRQDMGQLVAIDFGGVKQLETLAADARGHSTRLVSPGYSPPEQVTGGAVGPAADFYALGRTCIHLLTGQPPGKLEDPQTGELKWRDRIPSDPDSPPLDPGLADLLDRMVQTDVRQRPASAIEIRACLQQLDSVPARVGRSIRQVVQSGLRRSLKAGTVAIATTSKATLSLYQAIVAVVMAFLDTFWAMVLGGVGGVLGALVGFALTVWTPLGQQLALFLTEQLQQLAPDLPGAITTELLLFVFAGLGTAMGLTVANSFDQQQRYWLAGLMGCLGYPIGGTFWQAIGPERGLISLLGLPGIATALLTLGLGLKSHQLLQATVAAVGTAVIFAGLTRFQPDLPDVNLLVAFLAKAATLLEQPDWSQLNDSLIFFGLAGVALGGCLGVSRYLIVPCSRFMGWN